jgi:hypothetical protein
MKKKAGSDSYNPVRDCLWPVRLSVTYETQSKTVRTEKFKLGEEYAPLVAAIFDASVGNDSSCDALCDYGFSWAKNQTDMFSKFRKKDKISDDAESSNRNRFKCEHGFTYPDDCAGCQTRCDYHASGCGIKTKI